MKEQLAVFFWGGGGELGFKIEVKQRGQGILFSIVFISPSSSHHGRFWVLPVISLLLTNAVLPMRACLIIWWERFHGTQKGDDRWPLSIQSSMRLRVSLILLWDGYLWKVFLMLNRHFLYEFQCFWKKKIIAHVLIFSNSSYITQGSFTHRLPCFRCCSCTLCQISGKTCIFAYFQFFHEKTHSR